jgi:hypothetical protein
MKSSVAIALCTVAGLAFAATPDAYAQSKKKAAAAAPAKQWTDCSKVEPAKRDVCIRNLPAVRGPVPLAGQAAAAPAAAPAAKKEAAPAKDAKKAAAPAAGINPNSPCAKVDASKRDVCLSRAPAQKGPGWAAFAARPVPTKKK